MKKLFPSAGELGLFALIAVLCAVVVSRFPAWDIALAVIAMPLFVTACVMGLRKHGHLSRREAAPVQIEVIEE